jgi:hypothetical protein
MMNATFHQPATVEAIFEQSIFRSNCKVVSGIAQPAVGHTGAKPKSTWSSGTRTSTGVHRSAGASLRSLSAIKVSGKRLIPAASLQGVIAELMSVLSGCNIRYEGCYY